MDGYQKGFTLIELLVVIIIIGIASTIIAVKSSYYFAYHKSNERLAKDIAARLDLAQKQAIFSMSLLGMRFESNQYQIVKFTDDNQKPEWQPLSQSDPFWQAQPLPSDITIQVKSSNELSNSIKDIPFAPQILLFPSGEISPFTLILRPLNAKQGIQIQGNGAGQLSVTASEN